MAALYLTKEMVYRALVQLYRIAGEPVDRVHIIMYLSANGHNDNWTGKLKDQVKAQLGQLVRDGRAIQTWPDESFVPISTFPMFPKALPSFMPPMRPDFIEPKMPPGFDPMRHDFNSRPQHPLNEPFGRMMPPEPDRTTPRQPGSKLDHGSLLAQPKRTSTKDKPRPLTDDEAEEEDEEDGETESDLSSKTPSKASDSSSTMLTVSTGASSRTAIDEMPRLFRPLTVTPDRFQMFVSEEKPSRMGGGSAWM